MFEVKDILVKTANPQVLDQTVQTFGAAVIGGGMPGGYTKVNGAYVVRCFSNPDFVKFAITSQGYGEVVHEYNGLYNAAAFEFEDDEDDEDMG